MALKVDYVARETASNLVRNVTISIATVLTVTVSLFLVGFSMMVSQGVRNATQRWQGGVEFVVFLNPEVSEDQIASVGSDLEGSPDVEQITFIDKQGAYEEFQRIFADSPEMQQAVEPDILPPSYRVVPVNKDADTVTALSEQYSNKPGVREVVSATDTIRLVQQLSNRLTVGMAIVAFFLLGAAGLLILNTIRMAMYARRREIEVMKLVGATNWFIRVPFMVEGLVQGVVGAALAIASLAVFRPFFEDWFPQDFQLFSAISLNTSEAIWIYSVMAVIGCVVGAAGAGVAVTRFLDI